MEKPAQLGDFAEIKASAALQAAQSAGPCPNSSLPGSTWEDHAPDQPALTVPTSMLIPTVSHRNISVTPKSKLNYCKKQC